MPATASELTFLNEVEAKFKSVDSAELSRSYLNYLIVLAEGRPYNETRLWASYERQHILGLVAAARKRLATRPLTTTDATPFQSAVRHCLTDIFLYGRLIATVTRPEYWAYSQHGEVIFPGHPEYRAECGWQTIFPRIFICPTCGKEWARLTIRDLTGVPSKKQWSVILHACEQHPLTGTIPGSLFPPSYPQLFKYDDQTLLDALPLDLIQREARLHLKWAHLIPELDFGISHLPLQPKHATPYPDL